MLFTYEPGGGGVVIGESSDNDGILYKGYPIKRNIDCNNGSVDCVQTNLACIADVSLPFFRREINQVSKQMSASGVSKKSREVERGEKKKRGEGRGCGEERYHSSFAPLPPPYFFTKARSSICSLCMLLDRNACYAG